jgi:hypothetical protein
MGLSEGLCRQSSPRPSGAIGAGEQQTSRLVQRQPWLCLREDGLWATKETLMPPIVIMAVIAEGNILGLVQLCVGQGSRVSAYQLPYVIAAMDMPDISSLCNVEVPV